MIVNGYGYRGYGADAPQVASGVLDTVLSIFRNATTPPQVGPVAAPSDTGLFGIPKTIAIVGGGVLALGAAAFLISRKKGRRSMAGYRRRKRSRRR